MAVLKFCVDVGRGSGRPAAAPQPAGPPSCRGVEGARAGCWLKGRRAVGLGPGEARRGAARAQSGPLNASTSAGPASAASRRTGRHVRACVGCRAAH
eukprot:SAG22_NODE_449_length_10399_cov_43.159515_1_plen_97_part_00